MLLTLKSDLIGTMDLKAEKTEVVVEMYLDDTMKVDSKFGQIRCA